MPRRIQEQLAAIRGEADKRASTMRALAVWSSHIGCALATLAFTAEVDLEHLLHGTPLSHAPTRDDNHATTLTRLRARRCKSLRALLATALGTSLPSTGVVSLRDGFDASTESESARADRTLMCVHHVLFRHPKAPRLIDGAVLRTSIGGVKGCVEAEGVIVDVDGRLHVCEISPVSPQQGRSGAHAWRATIRRAAVHVALLRETVTRLDAPPSTVSSRVLVAHPDTDGEDVLTAVDLHAHLAAFQRVRKTIPAIDDLLNRLPADATFTNAADPTASDEDRYDALARLTRHVGVRLVPSCTTTCGNALFCRRLLRKQSLAIAQSPA